jgi:hypothetical protein
MTFLGMGAGVAGTSTRDVVNSGMLLFYAHSTEYAIPAGVLSEHAAAHRPFRQAGNQMRAATRAARLIY